MIITVEMGKPLNPVVVGLTDADGPFLVVGCEANGNPLVRCPDGSVVPVTGDIQVVGWTPEIGAARGRFIVPNL